MEMEMEMEGDSQLFESYSHGNPSIPFAAFPPELTVPALADLPHGVQRVWQSHIWYPEAGRGDQESNPGLQLDRPMLYR